MAADKPLYGQGSMVGRRDYTVGDDGNYYNEDGERVYYWVRPRETDSTMSDTGAETMGIGQDRGGYYTEAEIRSAWDAKEGMGYLKQQTDWDNYMAFLTERQGLIQTGDLPDPTTSEYMDDYPTADIGPSPTPNVGSSFGGGREEEKYYAKLGAAGQSASNDAMTAWVQMNSDLMNKYGLPAQWQNKDGDTFMFNGSTFVRTEKIDDHDYSGALGSMAIALALSAVAGPGIVGALTNSLGAAGAKAAAAAIVSSATQAVTTGDIDLQKALIAAATAYGGSQLADALNGSGVIGEIGAKVTEFGDSIVENGGDVLSAAMQAGGVSLVAQLVTEGEIEWKNAAIAAAMAGGMTALKDFMGKIGGRTDDEFLQELAEMEEFEQAAIDADIKDPFLNPNYKTVGDGLVMNVNDNQVYGVTDDKNYGTMKDLDLDGDGQLSGNDLQNITTPDRDLIPTDKTLNGTGELSYGGTHPVTSIAYDENGNPYVQTRDVYWKDGDDQNLYYEDGTVAARNNGDGTWTFGDDANSPVGKLSEFGLAGNSGVIDFEQQADSARLPDTEQVIYDPETNSFKGTGTSGDKGIALPTGDQDHEYWLVRDEKGAIYVTDGYKMEPYMGGINNDPLMNDGIENYFRTKDPIWQHVNNGGKLPDGVNPSQYFSDIVIPPDNPNKPDKPNDPEKPPENTTDSPNGDPNNSKDSGGNSTSNATNADAGDAGKQGADAPKPADSYSDPFLQAIAGATNNSVDAVVERINNGESPSQIVSDPTGANVVTPTSDGDTTVTPATNSGGGTNTGTPTPPGGDNDGDPDAPKDGDPCTTSDGRNGVIQDGACVFKATLLSVDPSVWAGNEDTTGGPTDENNSGGDNNSNNSGNTTSDATPGPGNNDVGTTPGVLVVADDVWGTGSSGDGNTGTGTGTGAGEGEGEGEGGGGNGGRGVNGGVKGGAGKGSNTSWSPLYAGTKFRKFDKRRPQGMMSALAQTPNFTAQDNSQLRMGLLSSMSKDLA